MSLLIFDIDGTLCEINQPVGSELKEVLLAISRKNTIAFASGKPFGYVAGFCRQLGLPDAVVIGENGGTLMHSAVFPPREYYRVAVSDGVRETISGIRQYYEDRFGAGIWFQPNEVTLTAFPIDRKAIPLVHSMAEEFADEAIGVYRHADSVDFVPKGFDKGTAIDALLRRSPFDRKNIYVFGDGENDIPMFEKGGYVVTIGNRALFEGMSSENLDNITALQDYLRVTFGI